MLPIRANANVVINENNPSSAQRTFGLLQSRTISRNPLVLWSVIYGIYTGLDENEPYIDDKPKYEKDDKTGKYVIVNDYKNAKQNYNSSHAPILPRMWSSENAENYMMFTGLFGFYN